LSFVEVWIVGIVLCYVRVHGLLRLLLANKSLVDDLRYKLSDLRGDLMLCVESWELYRGLIEHALVGEWHLLDHSGLRESYHLGVVHL
jgi:hypothetical protein